METRRVLFFRVVKARIPSSCKRLEAASRVPPESRFVGGEEGGSFAPAAPFAATGGARVRTVEASWQGCRDAGSSCCSFGVSGSAARASSPSSTVPRQSHCRAGGEEICYFAFTTVLRVRIPPGPRLGARSSKVEHVPQGAGRRCAASQVSPVPRFGNFSLAVVKRSAFFGTAPGHAPRRPPAREGSRSRRFPAKAVWRW